MYRICRHTMPSGRRCKSPAAGASAFCFHHTRARRTQSRSAQKAKVPDLRSETIQYLRFYCHRTAASLPGPPSARQATQIALAAVLNGLSGNHISSADAGRLLEALNLAVRVAVTDTTAVS